MGFEKGVAKSLREGALSEAVRAARSRTGHKNTGGLGRDEQSPVSFVDVC